MSVDTLIDVQELSVKFPADHDWKGRARRWVHAVNGVDLKVKQGETVGLVGESGCGKSTLARALLGLTKPTGGIILYRGQPLTDGSGKRRRDLRQHIQIVFQDPDGSLNPRLPAWRLVTEPLEIQAHSPHNIRREKAEKILQLVGMHSGHMERLPHEFSGGQRQRLAIGRALALEPEFLVLDEPTSALDVSVQAQILNLLMKLQRELGLTYLFISHDVSVVRHICDRVAIMYLGQIVEVGPADQVLERPQHPYTQALMSAVPTLHGDFDLASLVDLDELPSNRDLPTGCFFISRCPKRGEHCDEAQDLIPIQGRRSYRVRCHKADRAFSYNDQEQV